MKNLFVILLFGLLSSVFFSSKMNAQAHIQAIEDVNGVDFVHHSIAKYDDDSFIVAGTVTPAPVAGDSDILLMKIDLAGNIIWSKYIDHSIIRVHFISNEFVGSILVDSNEDILVVGYSYFVPPIPPGYSSKRLSVIKLDGNGNLLDFLWIKDPIDHNGYTFDIYGFDIVQTSEGNYMVVGLGSHPQNQISSDKYSFTIGINSTLDYLLWTKRYRSSSHDPYYIDNYNSFNHILKIPNHREYGEVYLLTGGVGTDDQVPFIMLVDSNGNEIWQSKHTRALFTPSSLGISSLYDLKNNSFYSFYHVTDGTMNGNGEDLLLVYEVDGNTGKYIATWSIRVPNIGDDRLFINGMEWTSTKNPEQDPSIVFSGYFLRTNSDNAQPVLFSVDFKNLTINWSYIYPPVFTVSTYGNLLGFDQIIQPLHPSELQVFYQPKSFTKNAYGYQYSSINQGYSTPFKTYFFNTAFGVVECAENFNLSVNEVSGYIETWKMVPDKIPFERIEGPLPEIYDTASISLEICVSERRGLKTETNKEKKVFIYPNPVKDILYVSFQKNIEDIKVRNVYGQLMPITIQDGMIDFSRVVPGLYFIELLIDGKKEIRKIVKR